MIYITGDTHGSFKRFTKKERLKLPFEITKEDYMIICGDFGLLWSKNAEFDYNLKWLGSLPFNILFVQGNHENYDMIEEYPISNWKGGKVRHILEDKIILLERGQVFNIEGNTFFTFGGASSHDIEGGILDKHSDTYALDLKKAKKSKKFYRVLNESWWKQELPTHEEIEEAKNNLERVEYQVDYVISHCLSNHLQRLIVEYHDREGTNHNFYEPDILTDFFDEIDTKLHYKHWFCGHYHINYNIDMRHTILYKKIIPLSSDSKLIYDELSLN